MQTCFQVIVLKRFILDFFQRVMLNNPHSPLKVKLVDPPCISAFLQPLIHVTFAYLSLLGEEREFLRKMRLCVMGWGALVGMTLVLDALISSLDLVELICALLWK